MLLHKGLRLAVLACACMLVAVAAEPAQSAEESPAESQSAAPRSAEPKTASAPKVPTDAGIYRSSNGSTDAKSASEPPIAETLSDHTVPISLRGPAVSKHAADPTVPKPGSDSIEPKPGSDATVPKSGSDSTVPKPGSGSVNENAESRQPPGKQLPLFQPPFSSKPLRVLGLFPFNGYSHFIMFKTIMSELAKRGHQVTVVSPFPLKTPEKNYVDVDLSDVFPHLVDTSTFEERVEAFNSNIFGRVGVIVKFSGPQHCKMMLDHPKVKALLSEGQKFDIVFTEVFGTDCYLAIGHVLKTPTISLATSHTLPWTYDYVGDNIHPAIVPNHYLLKSFRDLSNFGDRLHNAFFRYVSKVVYHFLITRPSEAVIRETFGDDMPSLEELRYNVSLVMVNSHPSVFGAKPTVPRVLHVGGIHLQPLDPRKVPQDIKLWLDTAPKGVILFSLGSLVIPETIPLRLMNALVNAFSELKPLRVLWKYKASNESAIPANLPDNVKLVPWIPQVEVLSHPNTLAFMTHGGLMGVTEAVYYGVPMVGIPLFADQTLNIIRLQTMQCAVYLDHATLSKEDVVNAVLQTTTNSTFRQRIKEVSRQFRDRPMSPLDSVVWWTEYVVRHGGAPHLESPTARIPFWKYALLDVTLFVITILISVLYLIYFVIRLTLKFIQRSAPLPPVENKKKD